MTKYSFFSSLIEFSLSHVLTQTGDVNEHEDQDAEASAEDVASNLTDHPNAMIQYFLGTLFSKRKKIPYSFQAEFLKCLRSFGIISETEALEGLPKTPETLFSNFGVWDHEEMTKEFAVCENHHVVRLQDLRDEHGDLQDRQCGKQMLDGSRCKQTFLKQTHSATGRVYFVPKKPLVWAGLTSQLKKLFSRPWFMEELKESRNSVPLRGETRGDIRDSERFIAARAYLAANGKLYSVQIVIFIDWYVPFFGCAVHPN